MEKIGITKHGTVHSLSTFTKIEEKSLCVAESHIVKYFVSCDKVCDHILGLLSL